MEPEPSFSARLAKLREEKGWSAEQLARRLDASKASAGRARIANLESGRNLGSVSHAECRALEQSLGAGEDELWRLLMRDDRRVDADVRGFYEAEIERVRAAERDRRGLEPSIDGEDRELVPLLVRLARAVRGTPAYERRDQAFRAPPALLRWYVELVEAVRTRTVIYPASSLDVGIAYDTENLDQLEQWVKEGRVERMDGVHLLAQLLVTLEKLSPDAVVRVLGAALEAARVGTVLDPRKDHYSVSRPRTPS